MSVCSLHRMQAYTHTLTHIHTTSPKPSLPHPTHPQAPICPVTAHRCSCSSYSHKPKPSQLGIPTANLPVDATVTPWIADAKSGVYFGWASLELPSDHPNHPSKSSSTTSSTSSTAPDAAAATTFTIFPMVMSIGYNPFYNNTVRSAEVHVLDKFSADFYGVEMRLLLLGYIRDELNYEGLDALIRDINTDCDVARNSLARDAWKPAGQMGGALDCGWLTR